jgi:hypothetical protein
MQVEKKFTMIPDTELVEGAERVTTKAYRAIREMRNQGGKQPLKKMLHNSIKKNANKKISDIWDHKPKETEDQGPVLDPATIVAKMVNEFVSTREDVPEFVEICWRELLAPSCPRQYLCRQLRSRCKGRRQF